MEENINKKNNIQVNALNVGTEKASSKYYSYQNDSTDIIQANTNKFNKNQENSLSSCCCVNDVKQKYIKSPYN